MIYSSGAMRKIRGRLRRVFHAVNPASRKRSALWQKVESELFLREIGVKKGDCLMDFGCGPGNFCVPAASLVGEGGLVYAVDVNPIALAEVKRRAERGKLKNIRLLEKLPDLPSSGRRCDVVLLYDMLHFLSRTERAELYTALGALMEPGGILSVHLRHLKGDDPSRFFSEMSSSDAVREIEQAGFCAPRALECRIWHGHGKVDGNVWNFAWRA